VGRSSGLLGFVLGRRYFSLSGSYALDTEQGVLDPKLGDTLHLTAEVTCASPPHAPALCCLSCQTREVYAVTVLPPTHTQPHCLSS
jgi:hypothetical protein